MGSLMEIEKCQIRGPVSQDSPFWMKNHRMDIHSSGRRLTRKQTTRHVVARDLERYVWCVETQRKAKVGYRKTQARQCQKIAWHLLHFLMMENLRIWWKKACRKLEVPMPAAMPCKLQREKYMATCRVEKDRKTKYACVVEANESTRKRMEGSPHKNHEDHIARKGMNSLSHYNLVHKFIPLPQEMKIPDAKAAVKKKGKNSRIYWHGSWRKSETKVRWSLMQGMTAKPYTLRRWRISVISRIRSWNHNFKNTKVELYSEVTLWKMIHDHTQYYWTRIISFTNDGCKSNGRKIEATRMRRTSSRRSIC